MNKTVSAGNQRFLSEECGQQSANILYVQYLLTGKVDFDFIYY